MRILLFLFLFLQDTDMVVHTPEDDVDIDPVSNDALIETEDTIMAEENNDEDEIDIGVDDHTSNIFTEADFIGACDFFLFLSFSFSFSIYFLYECYFFVPQIISVT